MLRVTRGGHGLPPSGKLEALPGNMSVLGCHWVGGDSGSEGSILVALVYPTRDEEQSRGTEACLLTLPRPR